MYFKIKILKRDLKFVVLERHSLLSHSAKALKILLQNHTPISLQILSTLVDLL